MKAAARCVAMMVMVLGLAGPLLRAEADPRHQPLDVRQLDKYLSAQVARQHLPGLAVGIADRSGTVFAKGYGDADSSGRPVTAETPFILGSVSKPLTAIAVLQLVDAGRIELDAPLRRYVTDFRLADDTAAARITVRQLLQHTSGLPNTACETEDDSLTDFMATLRKVRPDRPVGASYTYCSGNYNLLGVLVERVTGLRFGDYVVQHVFTPIGMSHSFGSLAAARRAGLAEGHRWLFGKTFPHTYFNPSGVPAGYLMSSAADMCRFLSAELNAGLVSGRRLLSEQRLLESQRPSVRVHGETGYALGWESGRVGDVPTLHHSGVTYDAEAYAFLAPSLGRGAVILINGQSLVAAAAFHEIEQAVADMVVGTRPPRPSPLTIWRTYLIVDAVLAALLALSVLRLVRLRRVARSPRVGSRRQLGLAVVETSLCAALVIAVRWFFTQLGARNWFEIVSAVPDVVPCLLLIGGLVGVTGAARAGLAARVWVGAQRRPAPTSGPAFTPAGDIT